jgi:hypothetical protein
VDLTVTNSDLISPIHQLRDKIESETGATEGIDPPFRGDNYLGILDRVVEIVPFHLGGT